MPIPREHGAYGQLLLPMIVASVSGSPTLNSLAFAFAAVVAFLAHEPLLVLLGQRGKRVERDSGAQALKWLGIWIALVGAALCLALLNGARPPALSASLPVVLASLSLGFVVMGKERSMMGQMVVALTLPALALPVATSVGVSIQHALASWGAWSIGSMAAAGAVKATILHFKRRLSLLRRLLFPLLGWASLSMAVWVATEYFLILAAAFPTVALASVIGVVPPHPRHLRRLGWGLVASSCASAAWLLVAISRL